MRGETEIFVDNSVGSSSGSRTYRLGGMEHYLSIHYSGRKGLAGEGSYTERNNDTHHMGLVGCCNRGYIAVAAGLQEGREPSRVMHSLYIEGRKHTPGWSHNDLVGNKIVGSDTDPASVAEVDVASPG